MMTERQQDQFNAERMRFDCLFSTLDRGPWRRSVSDAEVEAALIGYNVAGPARHRMREALHAAAEVRYA